MASRPLELASPLADLPPGPTHYERLGVSHEASTQQVHAAFKAWHDTWQGVRQAADAPPAPGALAPPTGVAAEAVPGPQQDVAAAAAAAGAADASLADPTADERAATLAAAQLAHAVLADPLRRRVYDAFLVSHRAMTRRAAQWWRRPGFWRVAGAVVVGGLTLGAVGGVARLVWPLF